jgi:hypothetical protein
LARNAEAADATGGQSLKDLEAANLRANWRKSPEHRKTIIAPWVLLGVIVCLMPVGALVARQLGTFSDDQTISGLRGAGVVLGGGIYIGALLLVQHRRAQYHAFKDRYLLAEAKAQLDEAEADVTDESRTDFATLWRVTQKRLEDIPEP